MYWPVAVFEVACWVVFGSLAIGYLGISVRQHAMHIGLWMVIGVAAMSWLEAPFDNSMYAVFHPDFHRLPDWGPIGATQGQLPVIAPPGYILYFIVPALGGVALATWGQRRFGWRPGRSLLTSGLVVGIVWDAIFEIGETHTAHLWSYARVAPGLTISPGTKAMVPGYVPLAMAAFIMPLTWVLGRKADDGRPMLLAMVSRVTRPGAGRTVAMLVSSVVFTNVFYALTYVPHVIAKENNLLTQAGRLTPYPGQIATQPGALAPQHDGALGAVIIWGGLVVVVGGVYALVAVIEKRMSAGAPEPAAQPAAAPAMAQV